MVVVNIAVQRICEVSGCVQIEQRKRKVLFNNAKNLLLTIFECISGWLVRREGGSE